MNESSSKQLKIIVERAVRPVLASSGRKQKMREELLAHVSGVFEEESARLGDDAAALERTAQRFGDPAQVTGDLQISVSARDGIVRFFEGSGDEWFSRVDSAQGFSVFPSGHTRELTNEHFRLHSYWDTISASTMKRSDERFHRRIREKTL